MPSTFRTNNRTIGPKVATFLLVVMAVLVLSAGTASAQAVNVDVSDGGECQQADQIKASAVEPGTNAERLNNLPLNRWGGSTSNLHSRLGAKITDDVRQKLSRDLMQSTMMSFGDSLWGVTGGLVTFATEYSVLDKAGCSADLAAARLGKSLLDGVAPILVGAGIVMILWRAKKGAEQPGKKIIQMVSILAIFGVLLAGASQTAATNRISPGSPAYFATQLDAVVTAVAATPTMAMNQNMPSAAAFGTTGEADSKDPLACSNYVKALRERYLGTKWANSAAGRIPMSVSAMWEQSGLTSYMRVQFGAKNPYGERSYCRSLERNAGISAGVQRAITAEAGGPNGGPDELYGGGNNSTEDQAGVWWAACVWQKNGTFTPAVGPDGHAKGWAAVGDRTGSVEDQAGVGASCQGVWDDWAKAKSGLFEWSDSPGQVEDSTEKSPSVRDFMLSWHGDAVTNGLAVSFVYVMSSVVVLIVFGLISLGIIIAKSVGVVMVVMVFLMLTIALVPSQGESTKLGKFVKFWLGMTVYSAGLMFILSLVALVTGFVNQVGLASFGAGSLMSILWMGFAPVTAIILLHVVFKHAVGVPSPFKPGSAIAYGGAIGGAGAALGVGVDRMARRGRGMASGYGRGMAERAGSKDKGEKRGKGRDQKMPVGKSGDPSVDPSVDPSAAKPEPPKTVREGVVGALARAKDGLGAARDMGWKERARQAVDVPRQSYKAAVERWRADGGRRRLVSRAAKVGAGLTWAGIGGAATVLASPAAPLVAAAVGARALHRARTRRLERIESGDSQTMAASARSRSNERIKEFAERRDAAAARGAGPSNPGGSGGGSGGGPSNPGGSSGPVSPPAPGPASGGPTSGGPASGGPLPAPTTSPRQPSAPNPGGRRAPSRPRP